MIAYNCLKYFVQRDIKNCFDEFMRFFDYPGNQKEVYSYEFMGPGKPHKVC